MGPNHGPFSFARPPARPFFFCFVFQKVENCCRELSWRRRSSPRSLGRGRERSRRSSSERRTGKLPKKNLSSQFASVSINSPDPSPGLEVFDGVHSAELVKKQKHTDSIFSSVSNESLDLPLISEVSDGVHSDESFVVDPRYSASPDAFSLLELTPASKITEERYGSLEDMSVEYPRSGDSINLNIRSVEADLVIEHLKSAWIQIQQSDGANNQSKKLIETLASTVIEVFYGIHEEPDLLSKALQAKNCIVVTCLLVWMVCTLVAVYVKCHTDTPFDGPLPT
uniref:Uncharacterized protein n=1 Tax=Kalanchoe fedtschenkoi TaxID=63787 RepID=A0A7N0TKB9_KALFE